ncbi:MAG: hypothetical protein WCP28_18220 [Actinomycetes bacterium]
MGTKRGRRASSHTDFDRLSVRVCGVAFAALVLAGSGLISAQASVVPLSSVAVSPTIPKASPALDPRAKQAKGSIRIVVTGLPKKVKGKIAVKGPKRYKRTLTASATLRNLKPGTYKITASTVKKGKTRIKAYVTPATVRITNKGRSIVRVQYGKKPPVPVPDLRFNFSNAAAIAVGRTGRVRADAAAASNLTVIEPSGMVRAAVSSGSAEISKVFVAPDGAVFLVFAESQPYGSFNYCILYRVAKGETKPTCIDPGVYFFPPLSQSDQPMIQFDAQSRAYYLASPHGQAIIRRNDRGSAVSLTNDQTYVSNFLTLGDGNVIASGTTSPTGSRWTRLLRPSGQIEPIAGQTSNFIRQYPDGNVYLGMSTSGASGVWRYLTGSSTLDPSMWIGPASATPPAHFTEADLCPGTYCQSANISGSLVTADQKVFVIGSGTGTGVLAQYYPIVSPVSTLVKDARTGLAVGNDLILAGLNLSGQHIIARHNTTTASEVSILGPNQVEVYHFAKGSGNTVVFDGLRFSDGQYVLGAIDISSNQVSIIAATGQGWVQVQSMA